LDNRAVRTSAFYTPAGPCRFDSSPATAGPWSADSQHGGPPSALLAREFERTEANPGQRLARIAVEILRPLPVRPLTVHVRVARPGKRVTLLEGVIEVDGQEFVLARGWRITRSDTAAAAGPRRVPPPLPSEPDGERPEWAGAHLDGYMKALDVRTTAGRFGAAGPAAVWTRANVGLVAGEEPSPFERAAVVADSGSGVSRGVELGRWLAINVEMTLSTHRDPEGEWIHLDVNTVIGPDGTGRADTVLSDSGGDFGRCIQTLVVAPLELR
jgi:Thioesterase-like superfamily